jgi:hypothetical protein
MKTEQEKALTEMISFIDSIRPFTVGDMKKAIEGLNDNTQILFGVPAGTNLNADWFNVSSNYERPYEEKGYLGLTFFLSDDFDARQF